MANQVNPLQRGRRHDLVWKVYFKHDGCSMLLFDGLPRYKASIRVKSLKDMYPDWRGHFIITK